MWFLGILYVVRVGERGEMEFENDQIYDNQRVKKRERERKKIKVREKTKRKIKM